MAALLVLADTSEAMAPWRLLEPIVRESLKRPISRLRDSALFYFNGAPGRQVYRQRELIGAEPLKDVLKANRGRPALIFGEADATHGIFDRRNAERLTAFFEQALQAEVRPVVWINPMPRSRWGGSTTEVIRSFPGVHLLPLGPEPLMQAIDILRGTQI